MQRKIDCISIILNKTECLDSFVSFLKDEKLIDDGFINKLRNSPSIHIPNMLYEVIKEAEESEKIQLVHYQWTILPLMSAYITITTNKDIKSFGFGYLLPKES